MGAASSAPFVSAAGASFILSCARSGSTLTRYIVDTHPDIYAPSELDLGKVAAGLHYSIAALEGRLDQPVHESPEVLARVREILSGLMDSYTLARGKKMWCEKSPPNLRYREFLAAVFPEARFICLYRHCLDVARSCLEVSRHGFIPVLEEYVRRTPSNTVQAAVEYWVDGTSGLLDFERKLPERTFRLRYEDITANPEAALEPMFRFLGVSWDPDLLKSVFTARHDGGVGDGYVRYSGRIHPDSLGLGRDLPLEQLSKDLRSRMAAVLAELGYGDEPLAPRPAPPRKPESAPAAAASDPRERPSWVFEHLLPERLSAAKPSLASSFSCKIVVLGEGGGSWAVELDETGYRVTPGGEAAARIDVQASDLLDIVHGRANALKIVREGRIRVQGELSDEALRSLLLMIRTDLAASV